MKKALVTGANGFVGSCLCRELLANGYEVTALHREGSDISSLSGLQVKLVVGDIRQRDVIKSAFEGVEYVFHIAALFRQAGHPDSTYYDINVEGTRNVIECAGESGVRRVIHCSTVGVHSHIPDPPATEDEPYRPGDIYQETKCEGEKLALSYFKSGKIDGVVLRPAMIWGPGDTRTLKLFKGIAKRRFPIIGNGKTLLHWIMVSDLARAFRLAAETPGASGKVYIISGESAVPLEVLVNTIASTFGVKPPAFKVPAWPVQLLGSIVEAICIPFGIEPPIYRRRVDFFTKTRAFDSTRARDEIGFIPERSFQGEVEAIADWYIRQGWIEGKLHHLEVPG